MTYPRVLTEDETVDLVLSGVSIGRYGDGEMSIMTGGNCVAQAFDPALSAELKAAGRLGWARTLETGFLPCIVNMTPPKGYAIREGWKKWALAPYDGLWNPALVYGSSLITRPDSAPWIDRPDYWAKVRQIWEGRPIVLVKGTERSLRSAALPDAASVTEIDGRNVTAAYPNGHRDAFAVIARIERETVEAASVLGPEARVLICLGPTATVLAWRLAKRGLHAIDLGHLGMFMRHQGLYRFDLDSLISPAYRAELVELRKRRKWGADGHKHADEVLRYAGKVEAATTLDYGCGEQTLAAALKPVMRVLGYDPAIPGRDQAPKPCDLVVCLDVLEHVEADRLDAVLDHIWKCAAKAAFIVVSTRPANAQLPGGRNAHLIVEPGDWWTGRILERGWTLDRREDVGSEVRLWLRKP